MRATLLVKAWTNKKSGALGLAVSIATLLWPSIPIRSMDLWLHTLSNLFPTKILYPTLAFLVGSYAAIYFYGRKVASCRPVRGSKTGISASLAGILLGGCPACIPLIGFFLPLTLTITLSHFSWIFSLGGIFALLFAIQRMDGFKENPP